MTKKNILLIEPNHLHYELLKQSLEQSSVFVNLKWVQELHDGYKLLKNHHYDLIITELHPQPLEEWFITLKKLSHRSSILVLSARGCQKDAINVIKLGADDFIEKSQESLLNLPQVVTKIIEKKKTKVAPIHSYNVVGILTNKIKNITDLMQKPAKGWKVGKDKIYQIEKELESLKTVIKNLIT